MRTRTSFHADQAWRTLLEEREQLASAKLATHDNATALIGTMDQDALCEIDAHCGKFGHGWFLCSGRQHPDYDAMRRREQEPATPSIQMPFFKLKALLRKTAAPTIDKLSMVVAMPSTIRNCQAYFEAAGYDLE